ncbi:MULTISPECIES: carbohydrate ABC transporter permease [unclassified Paenibacillus]|uniref:carbohydrate ABC transporter permease n=1 Tax=unclassified Paenibacillus TaxID=185978 RepID=UPI0004F6D07C|nr:MULTISPECIES: sugar ABC transporter permease [unclassified Paenibacillus]AIQ48601.1 sugar ABC transporter permease [Paenibacillus sp. FSL R7-0273]AIQ54087.1 sugar ABC transporter permease [Paenibacillus sp. FSL R7-0331]OMF94054.1 sugar ABC transporter permease [Paenibacillus sp. FSL R7-0273]
MEFKWKRLGENTLFLIPSIILTATLGIYPLIWMLRYMFYDYAGYGEALFVGLDNFSRLLRDELFWESVGNTFIFAGGKLLLTLPLSLLLAVILNGRLRGGNLLRGIYFMPTVISTAVISVVFYNIFNSYNGMVNTLLMKLHLVSQPIDWLGPKHAMLTVILVAVWGAVGNYMLLFLAGLQSIPQDLYESAAIDGANAGRRFWNITLPMLAPVAQMVIMLAIIASLKGYESIMVITEGGPIGKTEVMYLYLYKLLFPVSTGSPVVQQLGYGSAVGFASAIIVGGITGLYFFLSRKMSKVY